MKGNNTKSQILGKSGPGLVSKNSLLFPTFLRRYDPDQVQGLKNQPFFSQLETEHP